MEPNAIFWLEFRQAKRNGLLLGLLLLSILSILGKFFAYYLLLLYFGGKIASQRLNEDMVLYTSLSPYQILNGKILFGLLCGAIVYTPTLILALLLVPFAPTGDILWLIRAMNGFLALQCNIIIVTGFMTGAKSLSRAVVLFCFLSVFGLMQFVLHGFLVIGLLAGPRYYSFTTEFCYIILFGLPAAVFAYFVGISGLSSNLNRRKAIAWSMTGIFALCFVIAFGYSLRENFSADANYVVIVLFFYFCPLIAAASLGGVFRVSSENQVS